MLIIKKKCFVFLFNEIPIIFFLTWEIIYEDPNNAVKNITCRFIIFRLHFDIVRCVDYKNKQDEHKDDRKIVVVSFFFDSF